MTTQKDLVEQATGNASDVVEKIAAFGSMDAVKESGALDELMGFIGRREIQLDGKDGNIAGDHPYRTGTRSEIRAEQPSGLRARRKPRPIPS